ncbi:hypothetical protein OSTOST_24748, partial [Ostertagia ostertagi]
MQLRAHKKAQNTPSAPLQGTEVGFNGQTSPDDDVISTESQNIPLMRVVMSKKQTKRKSNKILKEGLGCSLHKPDEHDHSLYLKEIPLNEVLDLKNVDHETLKRSNTHFFEIRTQDCTYYI